ncbi:MAG: NAD(P)H-hydrate epimerase, partial [Burkholderiales bacterium]
MPQPVYSSADVRRIEQANASLPLMERAGAAAADLAVSLLSDKGKNVFVLAGPGNNGGDAKVVARILKDKFFRTFVVEKTEDIPKNTQWNLIVDGLFGIGLARSVEGEYAKLIDYVNAQSCPVLALDVPSGLDADTGRVLGRAVRATHTISFIGLKPGLLMLDGPDHSGKVVVSDLNIRSDSRIECGWIAEPSLFANVLKPRPKNFHKGMAGSVAVIGGASGMTGA